jgi:putative ATP-binding cassette transporter
LCCKSGSKQQQAYLEDRPIYLFDEWASDQDPIFKKTFYEQLLPELKAKGKTVLVISHDEQYSNGQEA